MIHLIPSPPRQVSCKVLTVLTQYASTSNYFWMLCQGIYLHTLIIVAVFVGEQQLFWYYVLGWGESWGLDSSLPPPASCGVSVWSASILWSWWDKTSQRPWWPVDWNNICRDTLLCMRICWQQITLIITIQLSGQYEGNTWVNKNIWYFRLCFSSVSSGFPIVPAATHAVARGLYYNDK